MKHRADYVQIRLTAEGAAQAGADGSITISNRHIHYTFAPGQVVEVVARYEWNNVLRHERTFDGSAPLLELVANAAAQADSVPAEADQVTDVADEGDTNGSL